MKMSKNSREHYHGVPNVDEITEFLGEISLKIMSVLFIIWLIIMLS